MQASRDVAAQRRNTLGPRIDTDKFEQVLSRLRQQARPARAELNIWQ